MIAPIRRYTLGMPKRSSNPRSADPNQIAARVLREATGEAPKTPATPPEPEKVKNAAAVELGRLGGLKGGKARAESLSPAKRKAIAKKAAQKRWGH